MMKNTKGDVFDPVFGAAAEDPFDCFGDLNKKESAAKRARRSGSRFTKNLKFILGKNKQFEVR